MNILERVQATQKTLDAFKGRTFEDGKVDCIQLVVLHARHMGKKIKVPRYGDLKSAAAVLQELGFRSLAQAMDHHFRRIEQGQVMVGDIVEMLGQNGFSSLSIAVGNGRVIGFHESVSTAEILQPVMQTAAWRVD